jgi:hypothetical protein
MAICLGIISHDNCKDLLYDDPVACFSSKEEALEKK